MHGTIGLDCTALCALDPEERVLWASSETSHFRAMIRALLWGRYCAIVTEFQYNCLAEDLTQWRRECRRQPPTATYYTDTHNITVLHCLCISPTF